MKQSNSKKMKKTKFKKLFYTLVGFILIQSSCQKNDCDYKTSCTETGFSGFSVGTRSPLLYSGTGDKTVATVYQTRDNANAPVGIDWLNSSLTANRLQVIQPSNWIFDSLGNVFGVAIAKSKVYLAASDVYALDNVFSGFITINSGFGRAGRSGIYITDLNNPSITTPLVSTLITASANTVGTNTIPNSGSGLGNSLGNIVYDKTHNQLFATNLEDGRIYRIDAGSGTILSIFDPFALDNGIAGIAPLTERIWGIGILTTGSGTRVYFCRTTSMSTKDICSIGLTPSGEFSATNSGGQLFIDAPTSSIVEITGVSGSQNKITDIEFSQNGEMLLAERGHPHDSQIFEYKKVGTSWILTTTNYAIGGAPSKQDRNAAGGVSYSNQYDAKTDSSKCDYYVWATSNYISTSTGGYLVYGAQGIKRTGNNSSLASTNPNSVTDIFIDYHGAKSPISTKGKIGDIEFFEPQCPCK